jgi:flagellar biogenesis protein FliO
MLRLPRLRALALVVALLACPWAASAIDNDPDVVITPREGAGVNAEGAKGIDGPAVSGPAMLAVTAVMAVGAYFLFRRFRTSLGNRLSQRSAGAIEISRTRNLGNRQYLVVVQVEGKRLLLGVGPGFINNLADLEPEDYSIPYERKPQPEAAPAPKEPLAFNNLISRINESLSRKDDGEGSRR